MTPQDRQKLKDSGFSDADIAVYEQNEATPQTGVTPAVASSAGSNLPDTLPVPQATTTYPTAPVTTSETDTAGTVAEGLQMMQNNPKTTAVATELGLAALPQSIADRIPVVKQASQLAKLPFDIVSGGYEQWKAANINNLIETIRKADRFGQDTTAMREQLSRLTGGAAPQSTNPSVQNLQQGMNNMVRGTPVAPTQPMSAPVAPQPGQAAIQGAEAATQGENWMAKAVNMAKQVGPTLEQYGTRAAQAMAPVTEALAPVGRVMAPIARFAGSAPVMGAQLALTPSSTGPQVPTAGPYRGMEINPNTRRPWTAQEIQQANQMPMPQQVRR